MIIQIKNLTKKYGNLVAVRDVSFDIEENQIYALLGLNGAGKTTLIKMLTCLTAPSGGDAFICGKSILQHQSKIKELLNISPQETSIAQNLTVMENLVFVAQIYGLSKEETIKRSEEMIALFHLHDKKDVLTKKLSGGLQRRLGIAMALITKPKILFLDEPTLGLDILARRELWNIIKALKQTTTIILTTHYLEEVEHLADEVAIMKQGSIIAKGNIQDIVKQTNSKNFEDAFVLLSEKEDCI